MKTNKNKKETNFKKITTAIIAISVLFITININSQTVPIQLKLKNNNEDGTGYSLSNQNSEENTPSLTQKPTKRIYFVPGGKIGMFFLQGDYTGNQLIALEIFGKYVGDNFFAEISLPFRFKTTPAWTDIGLDLNVFYPFLQKSKGEIDPYIGGGLGLHFIGADIDNGSGTNHIAARGGLGLNIIAGVVFFKNYDFNVVVEVKYFNYLREFDDKKYQGIGLNIGATFPQFK